MPSPDYSDAASNANNTPRLNKLREAQSSYVDGTGKAAEKFGQAPRHLALSDEGKAKAAKEMQRKLSSLQRNAPKTAVSLSKGKKMAVAKFAGNLLMQIDWTTDWLFILLASFALLKDIFDIVFAAAGTAAGTAIGWIPVIGQIGAVSLAAIGMTITFTGDMMFLILTVTVLVLVGSSLKNRGMAKYFIGIAMEFIAEALPGISWLPWTFVYVFILYGCVLYDRAYGTAKQTEHVENSSQTENENAEIPASGTAADGYPADERLAA